MNDIFSGQVYIINFIHVLESILWEESIKNVLFSVAELNSFDYILPCENLYKTYFRKTIWRLLTQKNKLLKQG